MMSCRWMKGALNAPDESGRIRLAMGETGGIRFKGRGREILLRHEGLAPVRLPRLENRIGLFEADVFLA